jgi:hypothetical protein
MTKRDASIFSAAIRRLESRDGERRRTLHMSASVLSKILNAAIAVVGIDIGKNAFHVVGQDERGAIVLHQKWSRGQLAARFASMPPCLVGMEACVGAHHLSRRLKAKGQKNDFRDAEAPRRCNGQR